MKKILFIALATLSMSSFAAFNMNITKGSEKLMEGKDLKVLSMVQYIDGGNRILMHYEDQNGAREHVHLMYGSHDGHMAHMDFINKAVNGELDFTLDFKVRSDADYYDAAANVKVLRSNEVRVTVRPKEKKVVEAPKCPLNPIQRLDQF